MPLRLLLCAILAPAAVFSQAIPIDWQAVLNRVSEQSIRGHLEFLSSDLLRGRATPSPGLDIAAAYIAAQMGRAGLEPLVNGSYYQDTPATVRQPAGYSFSLRVADKVWRPRPVQVRYYATKDVDYRRIPAPVILLSENGALPDIDKGRAVILVLPDGASYEALGLVRKAIEKLEPAMSIVVDPAGAFTASGILNRPITGDRPDRPATRLIVNDHDLADALRALPPNAIADLNLEARPAARRTFALRNVMGVLRGSDPRLRDTYVLVSAHYDHVGWLGPGKGDRVFNGANDDASGTAAMLELADTVRTAAGASRSGQSYSARLPVRSGAIGIAGVGCASADAADVDCGEDQSVRVLGRVDAPEGSGKESGRHRFFDFSSIGAVLARAGTDTGMEIHRPPNSPTPSSIGPTTCPWRRRAFRRTRCVAFIYPDYHTPPTKPRRSIIVKSRVSRAVALAVLRISDDPAAPEWNRDNAAADKYRKAREASPKVSSLIGPVAGSMSALIEPLERSHARVLP
ncbi:MAG: M28 family peptidase [Bryobacteraceae bacterium]